MSIGIHDEHEALRYSLQRWVDSHCPPEVTPTALDGDADALPAIWGCVQQLGRHDNKEVPVVMR